MGNDEYALYNDFINKYRKTKFSIVLEKNTKELVDRVLQITDENKISNDINIHLWGSEFQMLVWGALYLIPSGKTVSYQEIANQINKPNAVRAVGTACGKNPLAIIIPCHRVISSNGKEGGYRWGLDIKRQLIDREK